MKDLRFFEQEFNGVMPLEVMVDTRKKGHALKDATLKRISQAAGFDGTYPGILALTVHRRCGEVHSTILLRW